MRFVASARQRGREDEPLDVMFGPMGVGYYGSPAFDRSAYVDGLAGLSGLGVTYAGASIAHPGAGGVESRRSSSISPRASREVIDAQ